MLKQVAIASREIACYKNEVYCVFSIEVMTYGYHVYQDGWDAILGEELSSKRELGNHKYHCTCGSGEITSYHHSFQMKKKKKIALRRRAWAIIRLPKPRIKPRIVCHRARDQIVQALSPFFVSYFVAKWFVRMRTREEKWRRGVVKEAIVLQWWVRIASCDFKLGKKRWAGVLLSEKFCCFVRKPSWKSHANLN